MKKRLWLGCILATAVLFLTSCAKIEYEAYVTVVNIGNMPMRAWVDGNGAEIKAFDSLTWSISLESKDEVVQLLLEAEPKGGGDSDEITVILHGDRDIVTWLAGWDLVENGQKLKKESSLTKGPEGK